MVSVNQMIGIILGSIAVFGIIYYFVPFVTKSRDQNGDKSMMLEKGLEKDKIEAEAFSEKMKQY